MAWIRYLATKVWISIGLGNGLLPDGTKTLTHWGRVTHICVGNLTIIGPDNGLSPGRRQTIIWTNAGILLIGPWGINFSENLISIHTFSFKKIHLKMSSAKWRPFCLGLLTEAILTSHWWGSVAITWEQFHREWPAIILYNEFENYTFKITVTFPRGQWVNQSVDSWLLVFNFARMRFVGLNQCCDEGWFEK